MGDRGGGGNEQSARGGGNLAQQHQQSLQHRVGEAAAHGGELDHSFDVVNYDDGQWALVGVVE